MPSVRSALCRTGALAALAAALALPACDFLNPKKTQQKGEEALGTFAFIANATDDSCLSAYFPGTLSFDAELSRTKQVFYFSGPGGAVTGAIAGSTFSAVTGGTEALTTLCSITREETISGTFAADGRSIAGTYLVRVLPVSGSNCAAVLLSPDRPFATIPCVVRYMVAATRTDTPDGGADDGGATGADDGGAQPPADGGADTAPDGGPPDAGTDADGGR